jgi:hypothetical protein
MTILYVFPPQIKHFLFFLLNIKENLIDFTPVLV